MSNTAKITDYDEKLGKLIQVFRIKRGMSMKDLADKVGISFQQIQKYECASNRISASRLIQIAQAFDVTVSQLLGEASNSDMYDPKMREMLVRMCMLSEAKRDIVYSLVGALTNFVRPVYNKKN